MFFDLPIAGATSGAWSCADLLLNVGGKVRECV